MAKFYDGDTVLWVPEHTFVSPYAPLEKTLFDDPERLRRALALMLGSMQTEANTATSTAVPSADTVPSAYDSYLAHLAAVQAEQDVATGQKPAQPPARLGRIFEGIGSLFQKTIPNKLTRQGTKGEVLSSPPPVTSPNQG